MRRLVGVTLIVIGIGLHLFVMKGAMMRNWKTTIMGLAGLFAVAAKLAAGGHLEMTDLATLTSAIGLLFAKDHNVTGGTVQQ